MPGVPLIAIVDDDDSLRKSLDNLLRSVGFRTQGFSSAEAFLSSDHIHDTACLILDARMPGMSGLISSVSWVRPTGISRLSSSQPTPTTTRVREPLPLAQWTFCTNPSARKNYLMR